MKIFNFHIELILALQFLTTAIVITVYAVVTSLQEAKADYLNECHMVLMVSFVLDNHPRIRTLLELAEAKQEHLDDSITQINSLAKRLTKFREVGDLPSESSFEGSNLRDNLLAMLIAPFAGIAMTLFFFAEEKQYRLSRIQHTEIRKNIFSKFTFVLFSNVFALLIILIFVFPHSSFWGYLAIVAIAVAIIACIVSMATFVWWQMSWKDYWQSKLLEVMGFAGKQNNHDLFNRAMILKGYVESQPDVPIPASLGFYLAIYSVVQGILFAIFRVI
jgi:hypothetical protein